MKDIFDKHGHITDYGFDLLIRGEPTELQRLEIAEHLDYCDRCIAKYVENMEGITLLTPMESVSESVFVRIKREARKFFFSRYGMAAVAACFTMIIWVSGAFSIDNIDRGNIDDYLRTPRINKFIDKSNNIFDRFTDRANDIFNNIEFKEDINNGKKL